MDVQQTMRQTISFGPQLAIIPLCLKAQKVSYLPLVNIVICGPLLLPQLLALYMEDLELII